MEAKCNNCNSKYNISNINEVLENEIDKNELYLYKCPNCNKIELSLHITLGTQKKDNACPSIKLNIENAKLKRKYENNINDNIPNYIDFPIVKKPTIYKKENIDLKSKEFKYKVK
jgi:DNA-directed RNA polymerase subunit RPC12/RpoP